MKWDGHPNLRKRPRTPAKGRGAVQRAIKRAFAATSASALTSTQIYDWAHVRRRLGRRKSMPAPHFSEADKARIAASYAPHEREAAIAIQNIGSSSIPAKYHCSATREQSAIIVAPTRDASSGQTGPSRPRALAVRWCAVPVLRMVRPNFLLIEAR